MMVSIATCCPAAGSSCRCDRWSASIDDNSPVEEGAKPLDTKDNSPTLALPSDELAKILNTKNDPEDSAS